MLSIFRRSTRDHATPTRDVPHADTAAPSSHAPSALSERAESAALALLKAQALELLKAADDLDKAAGWLRDAGKGVKANSTHLAAMRVRAQAQEWL